MNTCQKTGDACKDLTLIFPSTFDGKVDLFKGEVNLKASPDADPVQLHPCIHSSAECYSKAKGRGSKGIQMEWGS